jgi:hypothetical protein
MVEGKSDYPRRSPPVILEAHCNIFVSDMSNLRPKTMILQLVLQKT